MILTSLFLTCLPFSHIGKDRIQRAKSIYIGPRSVILLGCRAEAKANHTAGKDFLKCKMFS